MVGEVETPLEHCSHHLIFPEHLVDHVIESELRKLEYLREQIATNTDAEVVANEIDTHFLHSNAYNCKTYGSLQGPDLSEFGQEYLTIGKQSITTVAKSCAIFLLFYN